jgi:hypothetical protein
VAGLCYVQLEKVEVKLPPFYTGSCMTFFKELKCHHAAIFQHAASLKISGNKIPTNKCSRQKKKLAGAALLATSQQQAVHLLLDSVDVQEIVNATMSQVSLSQEVSEEMSTF